MEGVEDGGDGEGFKGCVVLCAMGPPFVYITLSDVSWIVLFTLHCVDVGLEGGLDSVMIA